MNEFLKEIKLIQEGHKRVQRRIREMDQLIIDTYRSNGMEDKADAWMKKISQERSK